NWSRPAAARSGATNRRTAPARSTTPGRRYDAPELGCEPALPPQTSGKAVAALALGLCSLVFSCLTGVPALILGFKALGEISRSQGRLSGKPLAIVGMLVSAFSLLCVGPVGGFGLYRFVRGERDRLQSQNNLHQMARAMHNYHDIQGFLPPAQ